MPKCARQCETAACDSDEHAPTEQHHKASPVADLRKGMRHDATSDINGRGGVRTRTGVTPHGILSHLNGY